MKKYLFLATAIATASLFTGCSNNEYVGDQPEAFNGTDGAIAFSMGKANTTRATSIDGEDAANKLNKQFWVYGWKTVEGSVPKPQLVFKNYKVKYSKDSRSSSNTNGWEYVGILMPETPSQTQTIKYWDYSASKYDFEAYSYNSKRGSVEKKTTTEKSLAVGDYEVKQMLVDNGSGDDYDNLYFAVKKTMTKPENGGKYNVVKLTFQSVLSKIRVGFYETIPGYSVKITKFYGPKDTEPGTVWATDGDDQKFVAWCPNKKIDNNTSFAVTYGDGPDAIPAVTKVINNGVYQLISNIELNPQLTLGGNFKNQDKIGTGTSTVTWDKQGGTYTYFIPQNQLDAKVKEMKIKVDYTLTSIDGSDEVINVKGATAIVPKEYLKWEPNKAYSYVFKISDNTNGSTGNPGDEPAGLYPIIFDAVVEDYANEGSITTVSTPSVTAKQDGTTNGYESVNGNSIVFKTGKTIDLKVMNGNADVTSSASITGGYITGNYDYGKTPDQNCPNMSRIENSTLAGKDRAGYWVLKVETDSAITYVIIRVGSAEEYPAIP